MKTIYKYELKPDPINGWALTSMPASSRVLTVAFQGEGLFLWAEVDTDIEQTAHRIFVVVGTGHDADEAYGHEYVGTAFHNLGLVFHVFER